MSMFDEADFFSDDEEEYGHRPHGRTPERRPAYGNRSRYEESPPRLRSKMYSSRGRHEEPVEVSDTEKIEYMASRLKALEAKVGEAPKRRSLPFGARAGGSSDEAKCMSEISDMKAKVGAMPSAGDDIPLEDKVEFLKEKVKQFEAKAGAPPAAKPIGSRPPPKKSASIEDKVDFLKEKVKQMDTKMNGRIDKLERRSTPAPFGARQSASLDELEQKVEYLKEKVRNVQPSEKGTAHQDPW